MVPVAVSVPANLNVVVKMVFENWAFGKFEGVER